MEIGLIVNPSKETVFPDVRELVRWLSRRGCRVLAEDLPELTLGEVTPLERDELARSSDVVVVFGGDGTLLDAAHTMSRHDTPILGVNSGGLGFLTETTLDEVRASLERILEDGYDVQRRMMIEARVRGRDDGSLHALNDMVLSRFRLGRVMQLAAFVDGEFVTSYVCDGIIVSTPTGSTAYNLSASGPIVHPRLGSLILNPICPHTLTNRPLILPPESRIRLEVETEDECLLTADGQDGIGELSTGDVIEVGPSDREVTLIRSPERDFFTILRTKLGWGGKTSDPDAEGDATIDPG